MLEQKGNRVVNRLRLDQMIVVEDEDNRVGECGKLVDQSSEDGFGRRRLGALECTQHTFPDVGLNGLQSSDQVGQEAGQIVVALVEREPGDGNG